MGYTVSLWGETVFTDCVCVLVQADCVCGLCLRTVSSDCVYVFVWTVCLRLGYEYCYEVKGIAFGCFFMV